MRARTQLTKFVDKLTLDDIQLLNRTITNLLYVLPVLNDRIGQAEPPAELKRAGMLAYADGVNWNPGGTGEGIYYYSSGAAWVKL